MFRTALFTFAFVLMLSAMSYGQDWAGISATVSKSILRVESALGGERQGSCSAGIINSDKGYVLTAAHCVPEQKDGTVSITVNDDHAEVVKINYLLDLAILKVDDPKGGQLELRDVDVEVGTPVAFAGFAFGARSPFYTFGHISGGHADAPTSLFVDAVVIPGHSGGVLVDSQGFLVGTAQGFVFAGYTMQSAHLAVSSNTSVVKKFAKDFLPEPKRKN